MERPVHMVAGVAAVRCTIPYQHKPGNLYFGCLLNSPLPCHRGDMDDETATYFIGVTGLLMTIAAVAMMYLALVEISS
jgi:hypothetical protein